MTRNLPSILQRLWGPLGSRERTAATALLLLLVVGAAASNRGIRPAPSSVAAHRVAEQRVARGVSAATTVAGEPVDRVPVPLTFAAPVRSLLRGELPMVRGPDLT